MYDVITFGSAALDIFPQFSGERLIKNKKFLSGKGICFNLGSKTDIDQIYFFSGGGATNAAATFVNQGLKTACCSAVGDDPSGQAVLEDLRKRGINTEFILRTKLKPTNHSIIFNTGLKKYRTVLSYRGASGYLSRKDIPWNKLKAKWFYLAPFSGELSNLTEEIVDFARRNKIKIAFNPGKSQLIMPMVVLKRILAKIDFIFLDQEEAAMLTGVSYKKEKEIFRKFDGLCPGTIIMGSNKGIKTSDGKNIIFVPSSKIKVADRTGAGDAFFSGFISGIIKKNTLRNAISLGMANSASCMGEPGAKNGLLKKR